MFRAKMIATDDGSRVVLIRPLFLSKIAAATFYAERPYTWCYFNFYKFSS